MSTPVKQNGLQLRSDWLTLLCFFVALFGFLATLWVKAQAENRERQRLLVRTEIIASAIEPEDFDELTGDVSDLQKEDYIALKQKMTRLKNVQQDVRFVYMMGHKGGENLFFYVDSEDPRSKDYSSPGDVYYDTNDLELSSFKSGTSFVEGPYKDNWGEWVSGAAHILDPKTGETLAAVGMDIDASLWQADIFRETLVPILITLFFLGLLIFYIFFRRRVQRYIDQVRSSEADAELQKDRLRALYEIGTQQNATVEDQFLQALETGRKSLHMSMALLNRIDGDNFTVEYCVAPVKTVKRGDRFALADTYCDITMRERSVVVINEMKQSAFKAHPCYQKFGFESYIGVPVHVGGRLFGTLAFMAPGIHKPSFTESDKDFVRLMGAWMSATLDRLEVERMKSEFVSIASHQLHTPLTGIKWFVELLLKGDAGRLNAKQTESLEQVLEIDERLIQLVQDLLNVSHIETGRNFVVEKADYDLVPMFRSLKAEFVALAKKHKVTLKFDLPKTLVLKVDADKIRQVFLNLLSNAVKYSREKGTVEVSFVEGKKGFVTLVVKDQGLGIPKHQQARLFEKFFRAENVQSSETEGTGLGLYIAKGLVEAHGGKIWFESKEDLGTKFFVALPKGK